MKALGASGFCLHSEVTLCRSSLDLNSAKKELVSQEFRHT